MKEMERRFRGRMVAVAVIAAMAIGSMPAQAFAESRLDRYGSSISEYQAILDKLNEEYGTEVRLITQEDVDWAHERLYELYGRQLPGGPEATTFEKLSQYTLRGFEASARSECERQVANQLEQERARELRDSGVRLPQLVVPEPYAQSSVSDGGSPSRATWYYYFLYEEYATMSITKVNGNFTGCSNEIYYPNMYNFYQFKCFCFIPENPGSHNALGNPTLNVTWKGYSYGYIYVTYTTQTAYLS